MLAKLADLKARLKITSTTDDAAMTTLLTGVSAALARYCNRELEYAASVVEYFDGDAFDLRLKRYPLAGGAAAPVVVYATDRDWDGATAWDENDDYVVDYERGLIRSPDVRFPPGIGALRVTYSGGYVDPATTPLPSGLRYVPDHIREATLLQAADAWKRKDEPGYKVVWSQSEVSGGYAPAVELLPMVKQLLATERRL